MKTAYAIMANCNFESRDDACGKAIHAARKALESGLTDDAALTEAMDRLEETLGDFADESDVESVNKCRGAERAVEDAWTDEVQTSVEEARTARYVD